MSVASHGRKPTAAGSGGQPRLTCPGDHVLAPQRQSRQTRVDAVVVGVVSGPQGTAAVRRGRRHHVGLRPQAAPASCPPLGVTGKAGESVLVPDPRRGQRPAAGAGRSRRRPHRRDRRTPCRRRGRPQRRRTPRRSPSPCPPTPPSWSARWSRDTGSAATRFTRYKSSAPEDATSPPTSWCSAASPARPRPSPRSRRAEILADAVVLCRDWVNTPPGDCTPPLLAESVTAAHKELTKGRGAPKVDARGLRPRAARRDGLRRHPQRRRLLGRRRRGWSS